MVQQMNIDNHWTVDIATVQFQYTKYQKPVCKFFYVWKRASASNKRTNKQANENKEMKHKPANDAVRFTRLAGTSFATNLVVNKLVVNLCL